MKGSKRCSCSWACRRSHAAETTGSGSSHLEPRRFSPLRLQSRWPASGPCVWGQTSHQSLRCDCPPGWFSWSKNGSRGSNCALMTHWYTSPAVFSYKIDNCGGSNDSLGACTDMRVVQTQWLSPLCLSLDSPTISSQTAAVLSKEQEARTCPNSGWAQVTLQTDPLCVCREKRFAQIDKPCRL